MRSKSIPVGQQCERSAALVHLQLLTETALMCFEGDATAAQMWLVDPHVSLGGMAPMEVCFSSVLTAEAIRMLPFPPGCEAMPHRDLDDCQGNITTHGER